MYHHCSNAKETDMVTGRHELAIGVFQDRLHAFKAIEELHSTGFSDEQIGFIGKETGIRPLQESAEESRVTTTTTGVIGGGMIGGLLGAAVALLIPGIGPTIAGGILGAAFGGAALGAATGGIIGTLAKLGLTEEDIQMYKQELSKGKIIVTVQTGQRYNEAHRILHQNGAQDIQTAPRTPMNEQEQSSPYEPTDVSSAMPGPVPAPDIHTPMPVPPIEKPEEEREENTTPSEPTHKEDSE
jgi:hypothetical protein